MKVVGKAAIQAAYIAVHGCGKMDVLKPEVKAKIDSALSDVWSYEGFFKGENEELQERRLDIDSVADGEPYELSEHFKKIDPTLRNKNMWEVIFIMQMRLDELKAGTTGSELPAEDSTDKQVTSADSTNKIQQKESEETKMSQEGIMKDLMDEIKNENTGMGAEASNVKEASDATKKAVSKVLEDSRNQRKLATDKTQLLKLILAKRPLKERLVSQDNLEGTIKNPEAVRDKFRRNAGYSKQADGTVIFKNAVEGYEDVAKEIDEMLSAAVEDPTFGIKINVPETIGSLKGLRVLKPEGNEDPMPIKSVTKYIIENTAGGFRAPGGSVRLSISANRNTTKKPADSLTSNSSGAKDIAKIASVKIDGKKEMLEDPSKVEYCKENTAEEKVQPGVKSEIKVQLYTGKTKQGTDKKIIKTYRIPLQINQYVTDFASDEMREAMPDSSRSAAPLSIDNQGDLDTLFKNLEAAVIKSAVEGVADIKVVNEVAKVAAETEEVDAQKMGEVVPEM